MTRMDSLLADGPVLTDGAWGTQLQQRGLAPGEMPDPWNLSRPDDVLAVARSYVDAGARVVLTNTFGANRLRLADGAADQVVEINRQGARISRTAAGDRARVFASIGPTGRLLVDGSVTEAQLREAFIEQAMALAEAGADALVIETMSDLREALIAVESALQTALPVVACMVFSSGGNRDRTPFGNTPEEVARAFENAGAQVVGANCGQGIDAFVPVCRRLHAATRLPVWIKANAGLPEWTDGRASYATSPADFARHAGPLLDAGASFVGGCCGTDPRFIAALATEFSRIKPRSIPHSPSEP